MTATTQKGGAVTPLLREAWPRHGAKRAARAAGVAFDTARDWLRGHSIPSAETLLRMAERDEALADAIERRLHARRLDRDAAAAAGAAAPGAGALAAELTR